MKKVENAGFDGLPDDIIYKICQKAGEGSSGYPYDRYLATLRATCRSTRRIADELETLEKRQLTKSLSNLGCPLPADPSAGLLRAADRFHDALAPRLAVTSIDIAPYPRTPATREAEAHRLGPVELDQRKFNLRGGELFWSTLTRQDRDIIYASCKLPHLGSNLDAAGPTDPEYLARENDGRFGHDPFHGGIFLEKTMERKRLERGGNGDVWAQVLIDRSSGEEMFRRRLSRPSDVIHWGEGGDGRCLVGARGEDAFFSIWSRGRGDLQPTHLPVEHGGMRGCTTLMDLTSSRLMLRGRPTGFPAHPGTVGLWLASLGGDLDGAGLSWQRHDFPAPSPSHLYWPEGESENSAAISTSFVAVTVDSCAISAMHLAAGDRIQERHVMAWDLQGRRSLALPLRSSGERDDGHRCLGLALCCNILAVADSQDVASVSLYNLTSGQHIWRTGLVVPAGPLRLGASQNALPNFSISAASFGGFWVADGESRVGFVHAASARQSDEDDA